MEENEGLRAGIIVEETFEGSAELGSLSRVHWERARGELAVRVPYEGERLKEISHWENTHRLGELCLTSPEGVKETLQVEIPAGPGLAEHIKSGRRAVIRAAYDLQEPSTTLVSVDGEVFDKDGRDLALNDPDPFRNPLNLRISLWVPDLWSQAKIDESHELEIRLMQGEDERQILMPYAAVRTESGRTLAQNMAALANAAGGTIYVGAEGGDTLRGLPDDSPSVRETLERALLVAAVRCSPPIRFAPVRYVKISGDKSIALVQIPAASPITHELEGYIYRRSGRANIENRAHVQTSSSVSATGFTTNAVDFEDMTDAEGKVRFRNAADLIVESAEGGIDGLPLGPDICALLNSAQGGGRIVIEKLPTPSSSLLPLNRGRGTQQIDDHLARQLARLTPRPVVPPVQVIQVDEKPVAVITVPKSKVPLTLCDGEGYVWEEASLRKMAPSEAIHRYLARTGYAGDGDGAGDPVRLHHARLAQLVSPPEPVGSSSDAAGPQDIESRGERTRVNAFVRYDSSLAAQVWEPCAFLRQPRSGGYALDLIIPIKHNALTIDEEGMPAVRQPPLIGEGLVVIALSGLLASGTRVTRGGEDAEVADRADKDAWLSYLPIVKTTYLRLKLTVRLDELLQRRTKTSVMSFHLPDVDLDSERVGDLVQACADLGFRIRDVQSSAGPSGGKTVARTIIHGMTTRGYNDLGLVVGATCARTPVSRQLRHEAQRYDTRQATEADLDVRAAFWGTGEKISEELARLQMAFYETLTRRLAHLRTE